MGSAHSLSDRASQEIEVWWGGYDPRAMLPGGIILALLSALTLVLAWYFKEPRIPHLVGITEAILLLFWLLQFCLLGYRLFYHEYRLTTKRLFLYRGFRHPGAPGIPLTKIRRVEVSFRTLERLVGIGRIHVELDDPHRPSVVLKGLYQPEAIAALIRKQINRME